MNRLAAAVLLAALALPARAGAQHGHDDDRDHASLHFTHPLVTESPSPDTKVRADLLWYRFGSGVNELSGRSGRLELEWAPNHNVSFAVMLPYESRTRPAPTTRGFGNAEISLKAVTSAAASHGLLLGGGLSMSLPTGSDLTGIGNAHGLELEPFAHAAWMHHDVELVGFLHYATRTRLQPGEEPDRELTFDGSAMYHLGRVAQLLVEVETARALAGAGQGEQETSLAPGLEVVPWDDVPLMFGATYVAGLGSASGNRRVLFSAFYHF